MKPQKIILFAILSVAILLITVVVVIFLYFDFPDPITAEQSAGILFVNAKALQGPNWTDVQAEIYIDNSGYTTPFNCSIGRFKNYTVSAFSSLPGNYSFLQWESGQKTLARTISLDYDIGDLNITAYYSLIDQDSPTTEKDLRNDSSSPMQSINQPPPTFEDSFEKGLSAWTGIVVNNGAQPAITNLIALTGSASCVFQTYPTLKSASSMVSRTIATTTDVFARAYVQIPEGMSTLQENDRFYLIRIVYANSENVLASIGIRRNGTEPARWCLVTAKNSTITGTPKYGQQVDIAGISTTWTSVELHYNKTGGIVEAWIDGEKQITASVPQVEMTPVSSIQFGIYKKGDDGVPSPTGLYAIKVYFDDCVIDDLRIGIN